MPGYFVWTTPELFNLVVVTVAYFCWLYKEVAPPRLPEWMAWLRTNRSDIAAGVLARRRDVLEADQRAV